MLKFNFWVYKVQGMEVRVRAKSEKEAITKVNGMLHPDWRVGKDEWSSRGFFN